jgi:hypothetical protein
MEKLDYIAAFNVSIELDRNKDCPVIKYVKKNPDNNGAEQG